MRWIISAVITFVAGWIVGIDGSGWPPGLLLMMASPAVALWGIGQSIHSRTGLEGIRLLIGGPALLWITVVWDLAVCEDYYCDALPWGIGIAVAIFASPVLFVRGAFLLIREILTRRRSRVQEGLSGETTG